MIRFIDLVFTIYMVMLMIRILGSWLPEFQHTRWMQFVAFYTDPYLNFFRRFIPPIGMIDISPIFAFICLGFLEQLIKFVIISLFR